MSKLEEGKVKEVKNKIIDISNKILDKDKI